MSTEISCNVCQKVVSSPQMLKQHQVVHTREKPFKCSYCPRRFGWRSQLTAHQKSHTGKLFCCPTCGKGFITTWHLKRHIKSIHTGRDENEQHFLGSRNDNAAIPNHLGSQPSNEFININQGPANIFADVFKSLAQNVDNLQSDAPETAGGSSNIDSLFLASNKTCLSQGQVGQDVFRSQESSCAFSSSRDSMFGGLGNSFSQEDEEDCMITETENLPQLPTDSLPELHQFTLSHEVSGIDQDLLMPYRSREAMRRKCQKNASQNVVPMCYICGQVFPTKWDVYRHYTNHDTGDSRGQSKNRIYRCLDCGWDFSRKTLLMQHQKFHSGALHKCPTCGKGFTNRWFLQRHEKIHYKPQNKSTSYLTSDHTLSSERDVHFIEGDNLPSNNDNGFSDMGGNFANEDLGVNCFLGNTEHVEKSNVGGLSDGEDSFGTDSDILTSSPNLNIIPVRELNSQSAINTHDDGSTASPPDVSTNSEPLMDTEIEPVPVTLFKKEANSGAVDFEDLVLSVKNERKESVNFTVNICPDSAAKADNMEASTPVSTVTDQPTNHSNKQTDSSSPTENLSENNFQVASNNSYLDSVDHSSINVTGCVDEAEDDENDGDDLGIEFQTKGPPTTISDNTCTSKEKNDASGHVDVAKRESKEMGESGEVGGVDGNRDGETGSACGEGKMMETVQQNDVEPHDVEPVSETGENDSEVSMCTVQSNIKPIDVVPQDMDSSSSSGFMGSSLSFSMDRTEKNQAIQAEVGAREVQPVMPGGDQGHISEQLSQLQTLMLQQFSALQQQSQKQQQQLAQMQQLIVQQRQQQAEEVQKMGTCIKQLQQQVYSQQQTIHKLSSQGRVKVQGSLNFSFDPENGHLRHVQ